MGHIPAMILRNATFLASATELSQLPAPAFAEVAFAGRSNVGKSSLLNALLERRKLVRTSSTPGCTRGINIFRVEFKEPEATLDLVDLPGYGYAQRSKAERKSWGSLIEGFLKTRAGLRGVVLIIDPRRGLEDDDLQLLKYLKQINRPALIVATKVDKLPTSERKLTLAALQKEATLPVFPFSAKTAHGREPLLRATLKLAGIETAPPPSD